MTGASAAGLCRLLGQHAISYWVVGGWGVDALLGRCTRPHGDLDLIVAFSHHGQAWHLLHDVGFSLAFRWEENVDVRDEESDETRPTAYVLEDPTGRLVDIHVIDDGSAVPKPLWTTDRVFLPGALDATGSIDGARVPCLSARMQVAAHEGYELPEAQRADVQLLQELIARSDA